MTRTRILLALAGLTLTATLALAEPRFVLSYPGGVPQVSITGDYSGTTYTVWRQHADGGEPVRITDHGILCLGSCYAQDATAIPGETYLYLFEVTSAAEPGAAPARYGPYTATISPALAGPVGVFVYPNPGRGPTGVQLHFAGPPDAPGAPGEAAIYDLSGRQVRMVRRGPFARGLTTITWDGRDDRGVELRAGVYLLRFAAGGRSAVARIVRR